MLKIDIYWVKNAKLTPPMSNKLSPLRKEFFVSPAATVPTRHPSRRIHARASELSVAGTNMPPVRSTVDTVVGIR